METRNQRLIRKILDEEGDSADNSLHAQALRRATAEDVPRTMTPFEWEQWQAENGIPATLRRPRRSDDRGNRDSGDSGDSGEKSWLARLFGR